ncbi:MAG: hypothetical protein WC742_00090 [Gallionellaceae bacterium]|jgi:hypothetical protein
MLEILFGKKSDHPLASLKSVQKLLDDLPKQDAFKALQELSSWLESLGDNTEGFRPDHQVAVLRLLDEAAQPYLRKLLRDFFALPALSTFQENLVWGVLSHYLAHSEQFYFSVVQLCRNADKSAASLKPHFALLAARGIAAINLRLKVAAARYAVIDPTLWNHLAEIYTFAEAQNIADESIAPYSGFGGNSTLKREVAGTLVWFSVATGNLPPVQIHLAERMIAYLSQYLTVGTKVGEGNQWAINLLQPSAPMRVNLETTTHPGMRYVGFSGAEDALNNFVKTLEKGVVPQEVNLGGAVYDTGLLLEVAKLLLSRCILPAPMRRSPRRKIQVNLHIANGFNGVSEKSVNNQYISDDNYDIWEVEDISASGFRSVTHLSARESIKIGSLIGSKPENVESWGVGIVRRLSQDLSNKLHVGVEVLSNQLINVTLHARDFSAGGEAPQALYLNKPNDKSGEVWLLLKPGVFMPNRSFNMQLGDKVLLLLPQGVAESGEDYELVRYRGMEQDTGE